MSASVILASNSPQRADVLREMGIPFETLTAHVDEVTLATSEETVRTNARLKVLSVLPLVSDGRVVIAADTVIDLDGRILGKPGTSEKAHEYLRAMSGRSVRAVSAVAVVRKSDATGWIGTESANVRIKKLSDSDIDWYVSTGEPLTRAGAIGISHLGDVLVEGIDGSYSCVVGLPKCTLLSALGRINNFSQSLFDGVSQDQLSVLSCASLAQFAVTEMK